MTADRMTFRGHASDARGRNASLLRRLATFAPLLAILMACCPVPAGSATDTAFAAELRGITAGGAFAVTEDGRRVHLTFTAGSPGQEFATGQRVYVEGILTGADVRVRRMVRIEPSRTG